MNPKLLEAHDLVAKARESLRRGDKPDAWRLGEQAALLVPDLEDAWLILAASDSNPEEALAYAQKALELNPSSTRAQKAVEWTKTQLKKSQAAAPRPSETPMSTTKESAVAAVTLNPVIPQREEAAPRKAKSNSRRWIYAAAFLGLLLCVVGIVAAYSAVTHPAFASILNSQAIPTHENLWAPMEIAKPSVTPIDGSVVAQQQVEATPTAVPTKKPTRSAPAADPTKTPEPEQTEAPTEEITSTPEATATPGQMVMEIVEDAPTSESVAPKPSGSLPEVAQKGNGARWIDVDLTNQSVYAYEGDVMVNSFIVSTGTWLTPTVVGEYKIYVKYRSAKMSGPGYYLPNVPYIMYFYKGYGLHGTYWHNNFGTPMSHGCVNLRTDDAAWLYEWASVGTVVNVHY